MITWLLSFILPLALLSTSPVEPVYVAPVAGAEPAKAMGCGHANCVCPECMGMRALYSAGEEFGALFNSYETTWSKNGRLMIRQGSTGPYKFVKKG